MKAKEPNINYDKRLCIFIQNKQLNTRMNRT